MKKGYGGGVEGPVGGGAAPGPRGGGKGMPMPPHRLSGERRVQLVDLEAVQPAGLREPAVPGTRQVTR